MESEAGEMKRSEIKRLANAQLKEWADKNSSPGALPCVPIILINSLAGDKPGITMNMTTQIALPDIAKFLRAAADQVEMKIRELEAN